MLRLDEEVVVDAVVADVVDAARDDDAEELEVGQVRGEAVVREHAERGLRDVGGMHRIVVRVGAVAALHLLHARARDQKWFLTVHLMSVPAIQAAA